MTHIVDAVPGTAFHDLVSTITNHLQYVTIKVHGINALVLFSPVFDTRLQPRIWTQALAAGDNASSFFVEKGPEIIKHMRELPSLALAMEHGP